MNAQVLFSHEIFDHMLEGCQIIGFDWRYLYLNDAVCRQARKDRNDLIGKTMVEAYPGIDQTPLFASLSECMQTRSSRNLQNEFVHSDGTKTWFELSIHPIPEGLLVTSLEVGHFKNEMKQAQEEITASEARYRGLFEHLTEGFAYCKMFFEDEKPVDFLYLDVNASFDRLTGLTQVIGRRVTEVIPGIRETNPELFEIFGRVALTSVPERFETYVSGLSLWFSISVYSFEKGTFVAVFDNISGRKQADQELRHRESLYRAVIDTTSDGFWVADDHGRFLEVNDAYVRLSGYTRDELLTMRISDVEAVEREEDVLEHIALIRQNGIHVFETQHRAKDGRVWQAEVSVSYSPIDGGRIFTFARDITERKQALEKINNLAKFPSENPNPILRISQQGMILYANNASQIILNQWGTNVGGLCPDSLSGLFEDVLPGQPKRLELEFQNRVMSINIVGIPQANYVNLYGLDITEQKQAEKQLKESEDRFRGIYENATTGFYRTTPDGQILLCNPALLRMLGYDGFEEVARRNLETEVYEPGYERSRFKTLLERDGEVRGLETIWSRKDGATIYLRESARVIRDPTGATLYYEGSVEDISERKLAENQIIRLNNELEQRVRERTAELSDLYNNAPCGYHSLDAGGLIIRINDTELNWLGYTREEIVGQKRITDILTPASIQTFQITFPLYKERGWLHDLELEFLRKDGSILPILVEATAVKDEQGNFLMSRSTLIDHTQRKLAEQRMRESQQKLEAANKELEAFAYSVSHDLRAPLRAIDGFSRILGEDYSTQLDAEGLRLLDVVRTNTKKMDKLITDLLALSRVSRIEIHPSRIDMAGMASSIYQEIASPDEQEKLTLLISTLPEAYGDPVLMRQVWSNLLSNAIKYTRPKDQGCIEVGSYAHEEMSVYFVRDNGAGFNPDYTHKLFGVFQRLHRADEFEGTGVGLAIVQRIVLRHGGLVWAEGQIDQGAVFYFSLPLKEINLE